MRTKTKTLIKSLKILSSEIQSEDGVANATIHEAALRLEEMSEIGKFKDLLGHCYGGPSISFEQDRFVLYVWGDAPVDYRILAEGKTLEALLADYEAQQRKKVK